MAVEKALIAALFLLLLKPIIVYFYDSKKLRRFPNQSILSGITNLASLWERGRQFRTRELYLQHQKDQILRIGPNMLSFRDPQAIKEIYGFGASFQKHEMYKLQNGVGHMNILNVIDRDDHNRKRRMLSHAFSTKNLESWEFKITDKVEKLVVQFDKRALPASEKDTSSQSSQHTDSFVDAKIWFNYFTVDAIADIALSDKLGLVESGSDLVKVGGTGEESRAYRFIEDMHEAARMKTKIIATLEWFDFIQGLYKFFSARARARLESGRKFGHIVSHLTDRRIQRQGNDESLDDFFSFLLKDKAGKDRTIEMGELIAEANILGKIFYLLILFNTG